MPIQTWEQLIALPNPDLRTLIEFNPKVYYPCGSDWTSEGSNTYSHECKEVKVNAVTDDSTELTEKTSIADVKANSGSWYWDKYAQKIYVHAVDDDDLSSSSTTVTIVVYVWKHFSTDPVEFNGIQYRPGVRQDSLPVLDLTVDDIVEGIYKFNFGSFSMTNDGWWDKNSDYYLWANSKILIKMGGEDLAYSEYCLYFVGRVSDVVVGDNFVSLSVKDIRVGTYSQLPFNHYWKSNYPNMADEDDGKPIPLFYGTKENIPPTCIDPTAGTGGKWKIADSRTIKEIDVVRLNGDTLTAGTDYTKDLSNAEFTLLVNYNKDEGDWLEVDARGFVDGSSNLIEKGADIAKDILKTYLGFIDDDLDLDSFDATNQSRTAPLNPYIDTDESSREILQTIGRSIIAFFAPTEDGKLSFEAYEPSVPPSALKLKDSDFYPDWKVEKIKKFIRNKVKISYDRNPKTQVFKKVVRNNYTVLYKYGIRETLPLKTYLRNKSDAEVIAEGTRDMVSMPITIVSTSIGMKGFSLFPTRKVLITRERAADIDGKWTDKVFRIRQVGKNTTTERTQIIAMDDLQTLGESFCYVCYNCQNCVMAESSCTNCYSCQVCYTSQGGCGSCDSCELCVSDQGGCDVCNTCENCVSCQATVGTCETCETCDACQLCNTCEQNVSFCITCEDCYGCQLCVSCQVTVTTCTTCEVCDSCENCNTCQLNVETCGTCQNCVNCQVSYSTCPGGCDSCVSCQACNTCQSGVAFCQTCQECVTCQTQVAFCETCQECFSCQYCVLCEVCYGAFA